MPCNGATAGKFELAKLAKQLNLDAIHDTVHEMARDGLRRGPLARLEISVLRPFGPNHCDFYAPLGNEHLVSR